MGKVSVKLIILFLSVFLLSLPQPKTYRDLNKNGRLDVYENPKADIERLTNLLKLIDSRKAFFLMNYPDCPMMRAIALRWYRRSIEIRRTISGQVSSRGYTTEILVFNFEPD